MRPRVKSCYTNAQRILMEDSRRGKRLRYWEGLMDGEIPHAWLTINGKVVDVTADVLRRKLKRLGIPECDEAGRYAGVRIDRRTVLQHILETNLYGPIKGAHNHVDL
jgi:hypothetical protein